MIDFSFDIGHVEMHILGLLVNILSGPWMIFFYRSAEDQTDHVKGISVVKKVVELLNVERDPLDLLGWTTDIFGEAMEPQMPPCRHLDRRRKIQNSSR